MKEYACYIEKDFHEMNGELYIFAQVYDLENYAAPDEDGVYYLHGAMHAVYQLGIDYEPDHLQISFYNGVPVTENDIITFLSDAAADNKSASVEIDSDGAYTFNK